MKFILTKEGLRTTYSTTPEKVYEAIKVNNREGSVYFPNDKGNIQVISKDYGRYLEIPKGSFVGIYVNTIDVYEAEVDEYAIFEPVDDTFYKRAGITIDHVRNPFVMQKDIRVVADPWGVLKDSPQKPQEQEVKQYAILKEHMDLNDESNTRIKQQQRVAVNILHWAHLQDGHAFIGGGAPRNWYFGREAKDLDIFLRVPHGYNVGDCKRALEFMGVENIVNLTTCTPDGKLRNNLDHRKQRKQSAASNIYVVFEGQYQGETVQFIYINADCHYMGTAYMERYFDTSINMIMATLTNSDSLHFTPSTAFQQTIKSGAIFYQEGRDSYATDHMMRVLSYFPNTPVVAWGNRNECVKDVSKIAKYDIREAIVGDAGQLEF